MKSRTNIFNESFKKWILHNNVYLLIKPHPAINYMKKYTKKLEVNDLPNTVIIDPESDIYPILKHVDVLITDYSAIYGDFLMLNRPIIFFPYDMEEHIRVRGNYTLDYNKVTPGPKVYDIKSLIKALDEVLSGKDRYAGQRLDMLHFFFDYIDGNSSYRIFKLIESIS